MAQQFVNFGDVLCLNLHQKDGVVLGDGNISNQLYVDDPIRPEKPVHNLQDGWFVLVQRFQYSAKKAYEKALRASPLELTHQNWRRKLDQNEPLYKTLTDHLRRISDEKVNLVFTRNLLMLTRNAGKCRTLIGWSTSGSWVTA